MVRLWKDVTIFWRRLGFVIKAVKGHWKRRVLVTLFL